MVPYPRLCNLVPWLVALLCVPSLTLATEPRLAASAESASGPYAIIDSMLATNLIPETKHLVRIETWRGMSGGEPAVIRNLRAIQDYLAERAQAFNTEQRSLHLRPFEWRKTIGAREYWLFGYRIGQGPRKVAIITHLDTVAPGDVTLWKPYAPFEPARADIEYRGAEKAFLLGRGTIDDKGPTVVAFNVLRAVAKRFDERGSLGDVTLEVIFDTSEETGMATPHYLDDPAVVAPDLGVVLDALWCIRAEKGIEWASFKLSPYDFDRSGLWIEALNTPPGPVNQIPDYATATIRAATPELLTSFAGNVEQLYLDYEPDDPYYRKALFTVVRKTSSSAIVTTRVKGAQHGSAAAENRVDGANPLVSMTHFLAYLIETGVLTPNAVGRMAQFVTWGWGTRVMGENHPDLLERYDNVFRRGNGTTYAFTTFETQHEGSAVVLKVDIRYAIGHQSESWDGQSDGLLGGHSLFPYVLEQLVQRFRQRVPGEAIQVVSENKFPPDIRRVDGPYLGTINRAFKEVMGHDCPALALGGGTDAKGHPKLIAAGALFSRTLGPPVNFHGIKEAAPLEDLQNSGRILYRLVTGQILGN